nr:MAG TPA: protein of unknown function (DUF1738) [Caudoviricetes sp.]
MAVCNYRLDHGASGTVSNIPASGEIHRRPEMGGSVLEFPLLDPWSKNTSLNVAEKPQRIRTNQQRPKNEKKPSDRKTGRNPGFLFCPKTRNFPNQAGQIRFCGSNKDRKTKRTEEPDMTNASIILNESIRLMKSGILSGTGHFIDIVDEGGKTEQLEIPEEIHTFNAWKQRGYIVRKGEHAVASFPIWKYIGSKRKESDEPQETDESGSNGYCRMKLSHFFTAAQVQPLTA